MKNKKHFALFIMLVITSMAIVGQVPTPGPPSPPGLPIDGGLIFLVVSGVLYGVKKKIKN
ncbi:PID-CTERM protein-sorting domain-containing protein [Polaribacter butkevichii]|uniref:Signal peptidase n=1 Tax=Polaribacter butkevichii TaxID=218490 RepID=A0A2P6CAD6_9FLAO|nr:hypothetical protein [Polaribacter butkevichii]PQJ71859.1 hypothetical protein BTO14_00700 [Polaribacter butkevichii]